MNRVTRSTVVLAVALAALSCKGDPTDSLRNGVDHLVATPSAIFLVPGETFSVLVEAVDEQGNRQGTSFNLGTVGAGISVVEDDSFNLVFDKKGNQVKPKSWPRVQYKVTANANTADASFVVSAGGKNITIPVRIIPTALDVATLSNAAPALGDTIVITAPAPFKFTPGSSASAAGGPIVTLGISADSSQLTVVPGPSILGPVSVTGTILTYAPTIGPFTLTSTAALTTPTVASVAATFSSSTPAVGATLTITLPAGFKFVANGDVTFGGLEGYNPVVAADSNSISVVPPPGFTGAPDLANIALSFLLSAPISVPTAANVTVGAGFAGTDDPATAPAFPIPTIGNSITVYDNGDPFAAAVAGADRVYAITLGAPATLSFSLDWSNDADVDILFVNGALTGFISCFGGATGAQPENVTCALPAGTSYLLADLYAGTAPGVLRWTVTQ